MLEKFVNKKTKNALANTPTTEELYLVLAEIIKINSIETNNIMDLILYIYQTNENHVSFFMQDINNVILKSAINNKNFFIINHLLKTIQNSIESQAASPFYSKSPIKAWHDKSVELLLRYGLNYAYEPVFNILQINLGQALNQDTLSILLKNINKFKPINYENLVAYNKMISEVDIDPQKLVFEIENYGTELLSDYLDTSFGGEIAQKHFLVLFLFELLTIKMANYGQKYDFEWLVGKFINEQKTFIHNVLNAIRSESGIVDELLLNTVNRRLSKIYKSNRYCFNVELIKENIRVINNKQLSDKIIMESSLPEALKKKIITFGDDL